MSPEEIERALRAPGYVEVRRRVFRQLVESLVYEGALRVRERSGECVVDGRAEGGEPVRYRFAARRRYGFGRVAAGPVYRGSDEARSLTRFLGEVRESLTAEQECLARFALELEETLVKDALARHAHAGASRPLALAGYDELEGAITEGHRYHPAYKSRLGFDLDDHTRYGPEFGRPVRPLWLAARRSVAEVTASSSVCEREFLRDQLGESIVERWGPDYTFLPVHPWQWRERVGRVFAGQLADGDLRVVGTDPDGFLPQQSIRTMACVGRPERPQVKLALSIVNTSTGRGLAPYTVRNAAPISDWLCTVVERDAFLRDECGLILLREVLGSAVAPPAPADFAVGDSYGVLACIWRESLPPKLAVGERAVPFTGLTATGPDGTPLIDPWVRAHGLRPWLERLVAVSVPPLVHLLCGHGIALEAHAQNMVLVHEDGLPTRVALRDFHDGVRFSRAELAEPTLCPELAEPPAHHQNRNSFVETDDLDLVTDFLLDAFFFVNIGELGNFLADTYGLAEREFWSVVRAAIDNHRKRFPELGPRFTTFDVTKPELAVEKLTTRRLLPDTELRLHTVPNPLADQ